ncbi:hypothetical protein Tco_1328215 [Tanacetum coccineum]
MHTTMVPEQVRIRDSKLSTRSKLEDKDVIFSIGNALEDFILLYFILDRNIPIPTQLHKWIVEQSDLDDLEKYRREIIEGSVTVGLTLKMTCAQDEIGRNVLPVQIRVMLNVRSNHESADVRNNGDAVEPKTVRMNTFRPPVIEDGFLMIDCKAPNRRRYKEKVVIDCAVLAPSLEPPVNDGQQLNNLVPDESGVSVNETLFRGIIGLLMYLTASRPDIQFSTCLCARDIFFTCLDWICSEIIEYKWALFYCLPNKSLEQGLKLIHTDNDVHLFFVDAERSGKIHLYITHKQQDFGRYYLRNMVWVEEDDVLRCFSSSPFSTRIKRKGGRKSVQTSRKGKEIMYEFPGPSPTKEIQVSVTNYKRAIVNGKAKMVEVKDVGLV